MAFDDIGPDDEGRPATPPPTSAPQNNDHDIPSSTQAFVKRWVGRIKRAKKHYEKEFKRMEECMQLAKDGASKEWLENKSNYVVPVLVRLTNQAVAQLYAKNPTAVAKRTPRRMFTVWDGTITQLEQAQTAVTNATAQGQPADPNLMAVLADAEHVKSYNTTIDGIGDTLTILHRHFIQDTSAQYKQQFKGLVRRTKVCGVGYVKLGFQRMLEMDPDIQTKIDETSQRLSTARGHLARASREETDEDSADAEELKNILADLQQAGPTVIVNEGPVYTFPKAKSIIVDTDCMQLKTLSGANWLAEEFEKTPEQIEEIWGVDLKGQYTQYTHNGSGDSKTKWESWLANADEKDRPAPAKVWRVQNRKSGEVFVICDGYKDYLQPPQPPELKLRRFYDIFPLVFNEVESEDDLFPPSDVWLARHIQMEYNRSREALREHRQQNRPAWFTGAGTFEEEEEKKIGSHASGQVIKVNTPLTKDEKIEHKLQPKPVQKIDPALYETKSIWEDILRTTGQQQADSGPTTNSTATESSIAEQAHTVSTSDQVDDLDDLLTQLTSATGEVLLRELSKDTVQKIVGPGAVWPDLPETRENIIEELGLETRAGSSGRPNAASDLRKLQTAMPLVIQLPNVNSVPFVEKFVNLLDLDIESAIVEGLPSIASQNAGMGTPPGPNKEPASAPGQQGPAGAGNAPAPPGAAPGPAPPPAPPQMSQ